MDPFVVIILGGSAGLVVALLLLGHLAPGTGAEQLDWHPSRSAQDEAQDDVDDLDQLLEATNRRRRARGRPEHTESSLTLGLARETRLAQRRRGGLPPLASEDLRQPDEGTP